MNGLIGCRRFVVFLLLVVAGPATAADPAVGTGRPGDRMLAEYFRSETAKLRDACLADVMTLADWEAKRPELRRQLFEMLGLDPLPERTPLHAEVTGEIEQDDIVVERLHFQSRPGLYVTANLFRPKSQSGPLPAVLYLCGHGQVKKDGVSYGNKTHYHRHGVWFARNGYVCLSIDTLQLGEIEGVHHGTHRLGRWWWNSRGYTPAGVEAWNAIRSVDYLQTRPEVDGGRIGVTGRSGGGAYSWYVAALDDRIKAAVPVAGITDLENHVVDDCVEGHCDCMFFVNTYRWDYPLLAALVAPRPLLISNTDKDPIFPLEGVVRTHALVRKVYRLYGAEKKLGLHITEGPHADTQELRVHAFVWLDRHLKDVERDVPPAVKVFEPPQLKVFASNPADEANTRADETLVSRAGEPKVPESPAEWTAMRDGWLAEMRTKSFGGWPAEGEPLDVRPGPAWSRDGVAVRTYDFTAQGPFRPRMYVVRGGNDEPSAVDLHVVGEEDWPALAATLGLDEAGEPRETQESDADRGRFADLVGGVASSDRAVAFVAPRGVGPTAWTADPKERAHIRRRFMLLGQTLDGMRVWDVRRAVRAIGEVEEFRDAPLSLRGTGDAAVIALYASLFEPDVRILELARLPASHRDGPDFLNVLRVLDVPAAVAMAADRAEVVLSNTDPAAGGYARSVAERLGWNGRVTSEEAAARPEAAEPVGR